MTVTSVPHSPAAAQALMNVRSRMTNQARLAQPLTFEQSLMLTEHAPQVEHRVTGLRHVLETLGSEEGVSKTAARKLVTVAGKALFDHVLPVQPDTFLLGRFVNCAWRYQRTGWHRSAVTAFKARAEQKQRLAVPETVPVETIHAALDVEVPAAPLPQPVPAKARKSSKKAAPKPVVAAKAPVPAAKRTALKLGDPEAAEAMRRCCREDAVPTTGEVVTLSSKKTKAPANRAKKADALKSVAA